MVWNREQLQAYFTRIGLRYEDYETHPLNREYLNILCTAHATTMPFENLDILDGKLLSLRPEDLYDKIIVRHRGGNCFEMNGLCGIFLRALGFGVEDRFSRFFRDAGGEIPMRRHRLLEVQAEDGVFIWDIGIGMRSPKLPLRLLEGLVQKDSEGTYRFVKEAFYGWVLYDFYKGEWHRLLSFTQEAQADCDFVAACAWCELHPASPFNKQNMICIKTPQGRKTLDGNVYKEFAGDTLLTLRELSDAEIPGVLEREFHLQR